MKLEVPRQIFWKIL